MYSSGPIENKMKHRVSWQYDEFRQIGKDYGDPAEVEIYDSTHADFRDVKAESARVLDLLALRPPAAISGFTRLMFPDQ